MVRFPCFMVGRVGRVRHPFEIRGSVVLLVFVLVVDDRFLNAFRGREEESSYFLVGEVFFPSCSDVFVPVPVVVLVWF